MEYITTKEASAKWGISVSRIGILLNEGRIPGAYRLGKSWLIPATASKPEERKASRPGTVRQEPKAFSFPLYPFRPDWSPAKAAQLTEQQRSLLAAETAVMECRFADAWLMLEDILRAPEDIYTEIGCLWTAGMCCVALNKFEDFSRIFLRLQRLFSQDFPHRDDLRIILDELKTYVETMEFAAKNMTFHTEIHHQALPLTCVLMGYSQMAKEAVTPGSADVSAIELILQFLKTTSAVVALEMVHFYLLGIYSLRQNATEAEKHAKAVVQIAYENKIYFPLVTYYPFNIPAFSPILAQYPEEFRNLCFDLSSQYEKNFSSFISSINANSVLSKIAEPELPYVFAIMMDLSNTSIANKLGVHPQTVKNKIAKLCEKLRVKNKQELREYLRRFM